MYRERLAFSLGEPGRSNPKGLSDTDQIPSRFRAARLQVRDITLGNTRLIGKVLLGKLDPIPLSLLASCPNQALL